MPTIAIDFGLIEGEIQSTIAIGSGKWIQDAFSR